MLQRYCQWQHEPQHQRLLFRGHPQSNEPFCLSSCVVLRHHRQEQPHHLCCHVSFWSLHQALVVLGIWMKLMWRLVMGFVHSMVHYTLGWHTLYDFLKAQRHYSCLLTWTHFNHIHIMVSPISNCRCDVVDGCCWTYLSVGYASQSLFVWGYVDHVPSLYCILSTHVNKQLYACFIMYNILQFNIVSLSP